MKNTVSAILSALLFVALLGACGSDTPGGAGGGTATDTTAVAAPPALSEPKCTIAGEVLEGNQRWLRDADVVAVIKADSSTLDPTFGPSHRILEILDGRSCQQQFTTTLPVNSSPDFPYYLANIQYNKMSNLVGILGYYDVFICDLGNNNKVSQLKPKYFSTRDLEDPQTGGILHLEVWENFLIGAAQDCGAFVFDLRNRNQPAALLPFAEWQDEADNAFYSLFMMPAEDGKSQLLMPHYDTQKRAFQLYPLLPNPERISTNVTKQAKNNRFLVLRGEGDNGAVYPIDLAKRKVMALPDDMKSANVQAIVQWMRDNAK